MVTNLTEGYAVGAGRRGQSADCKVRCDRFYGLAGRRHLAAWEKVNQPRASTVCTRACKAPLPRINAAGINRVGLRQRLHFGRESRRRFLQRGTARPRGLIGDTFQEGVQLALEGATVFVGRSRRREIVGEIGFLPARRGLDGIERGHRPAGRDVFPARSVTRTSAART